MPSALITGAGGQDASYLIEHLLKLGYEVHGTIRHQFPDNLLRILPDTRVRLYYADMRDASSLELALRKSMPDEIYNLAAQSFVPPSFLDPSHTFDVNVAGLARICTLAEKICPQARIYQASTSEMFGNTIGKGRGNTEVLRLDESSPMHPVSPYGVAKLAAHKLCDVYRQRGLYVASGILFNHESPRRGPEMVTRKITRHIASWATGSKAVLRLGNSSSKRDWGFAGDYVIAMHLILQQQSPDDYVVGTGHAYSVHDFYQAAIAASGLTVTEDQVKFNCPEFTRKPELHSLVADYTKAKTVLGWEPKVSFKDLAAMMIRADIKDYESKANIRAVCGNATA